MSTATHYEPRFLFRDWEDEQRYVRRLQQHHGKPWCGSKSNEEANMSDKNPQSVHDLVEAARFDRPLNVFQIPESLAKLHGIAKIGLIELSAEEELMATKRSGGDPIRLAFELAKESLRMVDGRPVSAGDGSVDYAWNRMHPKIRTLVMSAYSRMHQPSNEDTAGFLASRQIQVG